MKTLFAGVPRYGVRLGDVPFGTVVIRPVNDIAYIVASMMDGTGHRVLITLETGTRKHVSQDTRVIPVDATVYVGGPT